MYLFCDACAYCLKYSRISDLIRQDSHTSLIVDKLWILWINVYKPGGVKRTCMGIKLTKLSTCCGKLCVHLKKARKLRTNCFKSITSQENHGGKARWMNFPRTSLGKGINVNSFIHISTIHEDEHFFPGKSLYKGPLREAGSDKQKRKDENP